MAQLGGEGGSVNVGNKIGDADSNVEVVGDSRAGGGVYDHQISLPDQPVGEVHRLHPAAEDCRGQSVGEPF
jgi:hypothetical protein